MASNASRGAAAKARTKKWLIAQGWQVADLEVVRWIFRGVGRMPVKRDQFASDLLAVNAADVAFIQVKSGESARGGTFPDARRKFEAFTFPPGVVRAIVAWPPRAREPRVVLVKPAKPAGGSDGEEEESGGAEAFGVSDERDREKPGQAEGRAAVASLAWARAGAKHPA